MSNTPKVKTAMMNFANGVVKEVKVGDTVFIINSLRGGLGEETTISKVGNKFITCGRRNQQYFMDSGREHSEYSSGSIYPSKEAYNEHVALRIKNDKFKTMVRESYSKQWTNDQLDQVMSILEMKA